MARSTIVFMLLGFAACSVDTDDLAAGGSAGSGGSGASSAEGGTDPDGGSTPDGGAPLGGQGTGGSGGAGGGTPDLDSDGDGISDADELSIAQSYRPFLSISPDDGCPLGGIVYRVRPHPTNADYVHVVYDHLFQNDCPAVGGHVGDNEAFGVTVDPTKPAPEGIVAIIAIGHQGTACEQVSSCGSCGELEPCATQLHLGAEFPIVYSSTDKHASYVNGCSIINCLDSCDLADTGADPPMVNVGEPEVPLVQDLTAQGFITPANGWTEAELMDFDPWDTAVDFGGAGNIAGDLVDPAFVPCVP